SAIAAAMATATARTTGSSQRGPRRRTTGSAARRDVYWAEPGGVYCAEEGGVCCPDPEWTACVAGLAGGTLVGGGRTGVSVRDSSTAATWSGQKFPGVTSG